jgi:hypothetical protein
MPPKQPHLSPSKTGPTSANTAKTEERTKVARQTINCGNVQMIHSIANPISTNAMAFNHSRDKKASDVSPENKDA